MANEEDEPVTGEEPESAEDLEESDERIVPSLRNRLRRAWWVLALLVAAVIAGSFARRYLDKYRAIVLDVRGDEMLLGYATRPFAWVDRLDFAPGQVIDKRIGSAAPVPVEPGAEDRPIVNMYERYTAAYTGTVIERLPTRPGEATTVIIQTAAGVRIASADSTGMAAAVPGARVSKRKGEWDPVVDSLPPGPPRNEAGGQAPGTGPLPSPAQPGTTAPTTSPADPAKPSGKLPRDEIQKVIDANTPQIQRCYEREIIEHRKPANKLVVEWTIAANGAVREARQAQDGSESVELKNCIIGAIRQWRFPAPEGGEVIVTYPFLIHAIGL